MTVGLSMPKQNKKRLFIAMPFDVKEGALDHNKPTERTKIDFNAVWQKMIKPAIPKSFLSRRANELRKPGIIDKQYIEWLVHADVVLADLTFGNANVYYELGMRHALAKRGTVLIAQHGSKPPFDVRNQYIVHYDHSNAATLLDFHAELKAAITNAAEHDSDSPVHVYVPELQVGIYDVGESPADRIEILKRENSELEKLLLRYENEAQNNRYLNKIEQSFARATDLDDVSDLVTLYFQIINESSVSLAVLEKLGKSLQEIDMLDKAVETFKKGLELNQGDFYLLRELGFTYRLKGAEHYHEAEKYFEAAVGINAKDPELQGMIGGKLKREEKYEEARERYLIAYRLNSKNLYAVITMAAISVILDQMKDAKKYYGEVLALCEGLIANGKETYWTYLNVGEAHVALGNAKLASEAYDKALKTRPKPPVNHVQSALDQLELFAKKGFQLDLSNEILDSLLRPFAATS